jgi:hypothetical protein
MPCYYRLGQVMKINVSLGPVSPCYSRLSQVRKSWVRLGKLGQVRSRCVMLVQVRSS